MALTPQGTDLIDLFYSPTRFPDAVVFDPFMGSGTTLGETLETWRQGHWPRHKSGILPPGPYCSYVERCRGP